MGTRARREKGEERTRERERGRGNGGEKERETVRQWQQPQRKEGARRSLRRRA